MKEGFVLADCNIHAKGKVTYLPIYMIMFIKNDSEDYYLKIRSSSYQNHPRTVQAYTS